MPSPMPAPESDPVELISRELGRIEFESYGTGAHQIRTFVVDDDFVITIIDNELSTSERTLLSGGKGETVKAVRMAFQQAIEPTYVAVVERALGRTVETFISHFNVEPPFSVEFFRLAPRAPSPEGSAGESVGALD